MHLPKLLKRAVSRLAIGVVLSPTLVFANMLPPLPHTADLVHRGAAIRIVAFGSSSTEGIGATSAAASYPSVMKSELAQLMSDKVEVINRGIGGEDIDDMLLRLRSDIIARAPDLVIWQVGSNDPLRSVPLDRFERELREGIDVMRTAGIDVMLMEPQWCPKLTQTADSGAFRDTVRRVGAELAIPVVRRDELMHQWLSDGSLPQAQLISADGLHMTDRGYELLGKEVAKEIVEAAQPVPILAAKHDTHVTVAKLSGQGAARKF